MRQQSPALPRPRRATTLRALANPGRRPVDGALDKIRDLTTTPAGSVAFVSIYMTMELCGLPSVPLAAAAGVAYPTKVALAVVLASSVTTACVAYYVGRTRLRPRLDKRISNDRRLARRHRGPSAARKLRDFSLRMVPMPPAINYLYGAMAPKFPAYFFSTLLGYLPGTVGTVLAAKGATAALPQWSPTSLEAPACSRWYSRRSRRAGGSRASSTRTRNGYKFLTQQASRRRAPRGTRRRPRGRGRRRHFVRAFSQTVCAQDLRTSFVTGLRLRRAPRGRGRRAQERRRREARHGRPNSWSRRAAGGPSPRWDRRRAPLATRHHASRSNTTASSTPLRAATSAPTSVTRASE